VVKGRCCLPFGSISMAKVDEVDEGKIFRERSGEMVSQNCH
jgi:hypothetical protein